MGWLDRFNSELGMPTGSYAQQGARGGAALGPIGMLVGYLGGRYMDNRGANNLTDATTRNQDAINSSLDASIWSQPVSLDGSGAFVGPPSYLAGSGESSAPILDSAQPWYENTSLGASDPLGLVPDYGGYGGGGGNQAEPGSPAMSHIDDGSVDGGWMLATGQQASNALSGMTQSHGGSGVGAGSPLHGIIKTFANAVK